MVLRPLSEPHTLHMAVLPMVKARRVYPIHNTNECAMVHLITLIIQPLVLASPNPPPKNLQTTIHRGGGVAGGVEGWV